MDKTEKKPDPFSHLGPPSMARRFGLVSTEEDPTRKHEKAALVEAVEKVLTEAREKTAASPPKKHAGGRPVTVGKPWEAEGIPRTTWYRRKREKAAK